MRYGLKNVSGTCRLQNSNRLKFEVSRDCGELKVNVNDISAARVEHIDFSSSLLMLKQIRTGLIAANVFFKKFEICSGSVLSQKFSFNGHFRYIALDDELRIVDSASVLSGSLKYRWIQGFIIVDDQSSFIVQNTIAMREVVRGIAIHRGLSN